MSAKDRCPFSPGDLVRFCPSARTRGHYQDIERFGVKVGETKRIKEIRQGIYVYFEDGSGGWPWSEFEMA